MNYDKIGNFIKKLRNDKNLTQKELASKINVTDKAISKWERGLGCPDVSLLEDLSKVLDVSILELLKGERIDNISIEESNKYIKEGAIYSKNRYKDSVINSLNYIILGIVVCIVLYIGYLNVIHYIYLNKTYTYDTSDINSNFKKYINKIDSNINYITNNKGIYEENDYKELINNINTYYSSLKKNKLLVNILYEGKKINYKLKDIKLYTMNNMGDYFKSTKNIISILNKYNDHSKLNIYDSTDDNYYLENLLKIDFLYEYSELDLYYSYKYIFYLNNNLIENYYLDNKSFMEYKFVLENDAYNLLLLTEMIMEVGESNE